MKWRSRKQPCLGGALRLTLTMAGVTTMGLALTACAPQQGAHGTPAPQANGPAAVAASPAPTAGQTTTDARPGLMPVDRAPAQGEATPSSPTRGRSYDLALYGALSDRQTAAPGAVDTADNIRRVTFAVEGADFDPQIDPTGQYIIYASTQHRRHSDIYIKHIDGTAVTQLTSDPADDMMPVFSPDGKRIAFCSNRSGNWDIYLMDVAGGRPVQLTSDLSDDFHPSFSPDGRQLVYSTFSERTGQWELVVIDLENAGPKRFIGHGLFPSWSPAGDRILFQRARERGTRWFSVWTLDLVNGEGVRPTEVIASANAAAITPRWSPDGRHIVFCTVVDPDASMNKTPRQADIWIIAADGSGRTNLTKSPYVNLQPVWAKDGTIYFTSNRGAGGVENIWSIKPDRALHVTASPSSGATSSQATTPAP